MFTVKVLASGSKANCYYISDGKTNLMIDLGLTFSSLKTRSHDADIDLYSLRGLLITHEHNDHIKGISQAVACLNTSIYCHERTNEEVLKRFSYNKYGNYKRIANFETGFYIDSIYVCPFRTSHDAAYPMGYTLVSEDNDSITLMTDTGCVTEGMARNLMGSRLLFIESNHDENMLMQGKYPVVLKKRILSNFGHLSNSTTSKIITHIAQNGMRRQVVLCHLSEENNTRELALSTTQNLLAENGFDNITVSVASQNNILIVK